MSKYKVLKDNLKSLVGEEFEKTLPIIAGDYEDKIKRQAAEITRLLAENEYLKKIKTNDIEHLCDVCTKQSVIEEAKVEGAEAAWELARKIILTGKGFYSDEDLKEIFEYAFNGRTVMRNYTYKHAAAKVAEWEKAREEVKEGDIVRCKSDTSVEFCVTEINCHGHLYGIGRNGGTYSNKNPKNWEKTGRHIDIDGFLKQIGGEE